MNARCHAVQMHCGALVVLVLLPVRRPSAAVPTTAGLARPARPARRGRRGAGRRRQSPPSDAPVTPRRCLGPLPLRAVRSARPGAIKPVALSSPSQLLGLIIPMASPPRAGLQRPASLSKSSPKRGRTAERGQGTPEERWGSLQWREAIEVNASEMSVERGLNECRKV